MKIKLLNGNKDYPCGVSTMVGGASIPSQTLGTYGLGVIKSFPSDMGCNTDFLSHENGNLVCKKTGVYKFTWNIRFGDTTAMGDGIYNCGYGITTSNSFNDQNDRLVWGTNWYRLYLTGSVYITLNVGDIIRQQYYMSRAGNKTDISHGRVWIEYVSYNI